MSVIERYAYSSAPERRERIRQFVADQGYCTVSELSGMFRVSEMTIRRDISRLVRDGQLRAFHGGVGAVSPQEMLGRDYTDRARTMALEKRAIAERAATMIDPGAVVAIDAGTTGAQLAGALAGGRGAHVVTHSLSVVSGLASTPDVEVDCLGGQLHAESLSFGGPATLEAIANVHVETLFLAASGLGPRGAFCATGFDAITKRALIEVSDRVVLIADSSKFEMSAMVKICDWGAIDTLVIDAGIGSDERTMLGSTGVDIITV